MFHVEQLEIFKAKKLAEDFKKFIQSKNLSIRKAGKESKISYSTLSRVQNNSFPDLLNYVRLCAWMGKDLSEYIEIQKH